MLWSIRRVRRWNWEFRKGMNCRRPVLLREIPVIWLLPVHRWKLRGIPNHSVCSYWLRFRHGMERILRICLYWLRLKVNVPQTIFRWQARGCVSVVIWKIFRIICWWGRWTLSMVKRTRCGTVWQIRMRVCRVRPSNIRPKALTLLSLRRKIMAKVPVVNMPLWSLVSWM